MLAQRCFTAWNWPIGRPNCMRVRACSAAVSTHHCATPRPSAEASTPASASTSAAIDSCRDRRHRDSGRDDLGHPSRRVEARSLPDLERRPVEHAPRAGAGDVDRHQHDVGHRRAPRLGGGARHDQLVALLAARHRAVEREPGHARRSRARGTSSASVAPAVERGGDDRGRQQRSRQAAPRRSARARPRARPRRSPGRRASSATARPAQPEPGQLGPPGGQRVGRRLEDGARRGEGVPGREPPGGGGRQLTVLVADRESGHGRTSFGSGWPNRSAALAWVTCRCSSTLQPGQPLGEEALGVGPRRVGVGVVDLDHDVVDADAVADGPDRRVVDASRTRSSAAAPRWA